MTDNFRPRAVPHIYICPLLGMRHDASTSTTFPSEMNYCQLSRPMVVPSYLHQKNFCLSVKYQECPMKENTIASRMPKELRWKRKPWAKIKRYSWVIIPVIVIGLLVLSIIPGVAGNFWQNIRLPEFRSSSPTAHNEQGFLETNAAIQASDTITPTVPSTETQVTAILGTLQWPMDTSGTVTAPTGPTGEVTRTFIYFTFTPSKTPTVTPSKTKVSATPSITLTPVQSPTPETPIVPTEPPPSATTETPPPATTVPPPSATTDTPVPP